MRARRLLSTAALLTAVVAATTGCGRDSDSGTSAPAAPPTASGAPTAPATSLLPTTTPPTTPSAAPTVQPFSSRVRKLERAMVPYSYRSGCPVPLSRLRMIEMTYWGMDKRPHPGKLVVNASAADDIVKTFRALYEMRYPIRRMEPVDNYKASDFDSIEADNTSAFNCRRATGSSSWSQHAYGLAVDINPCENPYVSAGGRIEHKDCVKFKDRDRRDPGVIHAGDKVVQAFKAIGWGWGGTWDGAKDYQHFSETGR